MVMGIHWESVHLFKRTFICCQIDAETRLKTRPEACVLRISERAGVCWAAADVVDGVLCRVGNRERVEGFRPRG